MWNPLLALIALLAIPAVDLPGDAGPLTAPSDYDPSNPVGVEYDVEVNGNATPADLIFHDDGTWEMWDGDTLVGWGFYTFDPEAGTIDYVNQSGDGRGNESGTYTWDANAGQWNRTWASNPGAPPLSLIPPG